MLNKLLKDLRGATAFAAVVKADHKGAVETGAARDALNWLKESREALADYLLSVTTPGDELENMRPAFEAAVIANQAKEVFDEPDFTRCILGGGEYENDLIEAAWWGYKAGRQQQEGV